MPNEPDTIEQLNAEVTRLMHEMLAACQANLASPSTENARAWLQATQRYIAAHRKWWALAMPDVDYDSVFGSPE